MRLLSPSTTLTLTSTVSPGAKSGMSLLAESFSTCSLLICWMMFMAKSPSAAPATGARSCLVCMGWASFYDKARALSPSRFRPVFGLCPGQIGGPGVGPPLPREPLSLGGAPLSDLGVVAGREHLGDWRALQDGGPGVLRIFQQAIGKTLLGGRGLFAHDAGQQPYAGVEQRECRGLAAPQHEVAERDFLELARRDQPLVNALETAAQNDGAGAVCQRGHARLRQRPAARAHQKARAFIGRHHIECKTI